MAGMKLERGQGGVEDMCSSQHVIDEVNSLAFFEPLCLLIPATALGTGIVVEPHFHYFCRGCHYSLSCQLASFKISYSISHNNLY